MRIQLIVVASVAATLAACSSGSDSGNAAPVLTGLGDTRIDQDSTTPLAFTVSDRETPAAELVVNVRSSNPEVVQADGLVLTGAGSNRGVEITPAEAATGSTRITVTVRDAAGRETRRDVRVDVVGTDASFSMLANDVYALPEDAEPRRVRGLSIAADTDEDDLAFSALIQ